MIYSVRGKVVYSPWPLGRWPLLHGDIAKNVPKILCLGRERIVRRTKIRPCIVRCKVLFFLCRRLSVSALNRITHIALRQKILFPLDKFSCIGNISPVSISKTFANLLIFHPLFLAANFLSIKIVSQKAEKCNRTFTTIRNVSLMAVYLNKFRFDYFFLVDRQFPNTVMKKKRLYRMVAPIL